VELKRASSGSIAITPASGMLKPKGGDICNIAKLTKVITATLIVIPSISASQKARAPDLSFEVNPARRNANIIPRSLRQSLSGCILALLELNLGR